MNIENLAAIVTGGASGLGGATASLLRARGARVSIFDLNEVAGQSLAAAIGGRYFNVDVAEPASVAEGLSRAESAHGVARLLINCAGVAPAQRTVSRDNAAHDPEVFRRTIEVNLLGTFYVIAPFAARLAREAVLGEERGVIVNTASVAAFEGQIGQAAYAASKGGIVGLTLPVARDLAQHRIRVVTIAPGLFRTPMLLGLSQEAQDSLGRQVPHPGRLGKPEEFAQLVGSIIENPMLNGETIRLDGAIRMQPR